MSEDKFRQLQQKVERANNDASRARGALDQIMKQLESKFECKDIKSAKKLLSQLEDKQAEAVVALEKAMAEYEKKWHD